MQKGRLNNCNDLKRYLKKKLSCIEGGGGFFTGAIKIEAFFHVFITAEKRRCQIARKL